MSSMIVFHPVKLPYMADWAERIMARLTELDKSQADLARHLKISKQAVSLWKTRATKSPEAHHLVLSAEFLETTERWILYGRDPRCYPNGRLKKLLPYPIDTLSLIDKIQSLPAERREHIKAIIEDLSPAAHIPAIDNIALLVDS